MNYPVHSEQEMLTGLAKGEHSATEQVYKQHYKVISAWIQQNGGTANDAADIFQESLIDIYNQAKHKNLELTCPFEPFLLLICKRKWLNEIKKRGRSPVTNTHNDLSDIGEDVFAAAETVEREEAKASLYLREFERLGEKCREIIKLSLEGGAQEKIAEQLGVTYGYLRKKTSEWMATLISFIQAQKI